MFYKNTEAVAIYVMRPSSEVNIKTSHVPFCLEQLRPVTFIKAKILSSNRLWIYVHRDAMVFQDGLGIA